MRESDPASKAILIDLDGVVYQDGALIDGADETLDWIRQQQIPYLYVTNTSSRGRAPLVDTMKRYGIDTSQEQIFTPLVAAGEWLRDHQLNRIALFVAPQAADEFSSFDVLDPTEESGAEALIIGDLGERWDFQTLNRAFRLLMREPAPVCIALGMTRYWKAPDGLRLDVAPFVKALEHASGCQARVIGKPSATFFNAALSLLNANPADAVMIGDDINSDVRAAQQVGLTGVQVKTGKFRPQDLDSGSAPDAVIDSIADFTRWYQQHA